MAPSPARITSRSAGIADREEDPGRLAVAARHDDRSVEEAIPAQYNSKSNLEKEIKEGENALDFELKSK